MHWRALMSWNKKLVDDYVLSYKYAYYMCFCRFWNFRWYEGYLIVRLTSVFKSSAFLFRLQFSRSACPYTRADRNDAMSYLKQVRQYMTYSAERRCRRGELRVQRRGERGRGGRGRGRGRQPRALAARARLPAARRALPPQPPPAPHAR